MQHSPLAINIRGLELQTPVIISSGCAGFGNDYTQVKDFSYEDVGAICLKGITLKARHGNPPHRLDETPSGLLNSIGLQNPGVNVLIQRIPKLDCGKALIIPNIAGETVEEYEKIAQLLDDSPARAIELNISCPNMQKGGMEFGNNPYLSAMIVAKCRKVFSKLLIVKLSPNQANIAENARLCIEAGADALAVTNTVAGMSVNIKTKRPTLGKMRGGLSGPAIKPIALLKTHEVYQVATKNHIPIIGQGGIVSAKDALEFIIAGANAIGIGTGLFYNPLLCKEVNHGILEYLQEQRLTHVTELTGTLKTEN